MFPKRPIPRMESMGIHALPWYTVVLPVTMLPLTAFPPKVLPPPPLPPSLLCKDTVITPEGNVRLAQFNPGPLRFTRTTWSPEAHTLFLTAINLLTQKGCKVAPTALRDKMRSIAPDNLRSWLASLTKDQVRSHLSYHRYQLRQLQNKRELRSSDDKPE